MAEYIEREAVERKLADIYMELGGYKTRDAFYKAIDLVHRYPAADVAPVRRGRWDENGRCTMCGGHAPFWCMASTYYKSQYCFECGAKTDLEERDGK